MISVVVPVYNVETYLPRCLDSIIAQSVHDFEVILIDDGSTDLSGKICDEYSEKYSNVFTFHKENQGLSSARNLGIDKCNGEYITFIDSDDVVSKNYLEILYTLIKKYDADISCCEFFFFSDDAEILEDNSVTVDNCFTGTEAASKMLYGRIHGSSACAIMLKRMIVLENKFSLGKYHEDDLVTFKYYLAASRVAYTSRKMYYYYQRQGSIMHRPFGKAALDELDAADYIVTNCESYGYDLKKAAKLKQYTNYSDVLHSYLDLKTTSPDTFQRICHVLNNLKYSIAFDKNVSRRIRLHALIQVVFGMRLYLFIYQNRHKGEK